MRGKASPFRQFPHLSRITPAYAGKSHRHDVYIMLQQDHPRLCGEKRLISISSSSSTGSPPPMRGKGFAPLRFSAESRITPAYAGKSWIPITQFFNIQDHPRLCGEKDLCRACVGCRQGSPPPMRGKAIHNHLNGYYTRITPAYAGKSTVHSFRD